MWHKWNHKRQAEISKVSWCFELRIIRDNDQMGHNYSMEEYTHPVQMEVEIPVPSQVINSKCGKYNTII